MGAYRKSCSVTHQRLGVKVYYTTFLADLDSNSSTVSPLPMGFFRYSVVEGVSQIFEVHLNTPKICRPNLALAKYKLQKSKYERK